MGDNGQQNGGTERSPGMRPYLERLEQVAADSEMAVMVLLNPDNTDLEFWPLKPRPAAETAPAEVGARQLRSVGVIGLNGPAPHFALKEPLDQAVLDAVADAFKAYVKVLVGEEFAKQIKAAKIEQLYYLWSGQAASDSEPPAAR